MEKRGVFCKMGGEVALFADLGDVRGVGYFGGDIFGVGDILKKIFWRWRYFWWKKMEEFGGRKRKERKKEKEKKMRKGRYFLGRKSENN